MRFVEEIVFDGTEASVMVVNENDPGTVFHVLVQFTDDLRGSDELTKELTGIICRAADEINEIVGYNIKPFKAETLE